MTFRKFGHGDGEVLPLKDQDDQPAKKTASAQREWTEKDQRELDEESHR